MGDVVNLGEERQRREAPDEEHIVRIDGTEWYRFSASYTDREDKSEFAISFWAKNMRDAKRKVKFIKQTLRLDGQVMHTEA